MQIEEGDSSAATKSRPLRAGNQNKRSHKKLLDLELVL